MAWYWILIIISAVIGPFEAMHALNKAWSKRKKSRNNVQKPETTGGGEGKSISDGESE